MKKVKVVPAKAKKGSEKYGARLKERRAKKRAATPAKATLPDILNSVEEKIVANVRAGLSVDPLPVNDSLYKLDTFHLTGEHVALLSNLSLYWPSEPAQYGLPGAPACNPSRPYGDSDFQSNIADVLGWKWEQDGCEEDTPMPARLRERAMRLHSETAVALQVVLQARSFEPGTYVRDAKSFGPWRREDGGQSPQRTATEPAIVSSASDELVEELHYALLNNPDCGVSFEDVERVELAGTDELDEPNFAWLALLKSGKWAAIAGWHGYTGWDCQSSMSSAIFDTRDEALAFGFTDAMRDLLGVQLGQGED